MRWINVVLRGELGDGTEQFQHHFDFGTPGSDPNIDQAAGLALAEELAGQWQTAFGTMQSTDSLSYHTSLGTRYNEVGVAQMSLGSAGGDATFDFPTQWYAYPLATRPRGQGTTSLPFEVACAVTFRTDVRGPRGRGRTYLPPFQATDMDGTKGEFSQAALLAVGSTISTFFAAEHSTQAALVPVVVSRAHQELHAITQAEVGKVPDSQRRRRRSQDEARVTIYTAPA